MYFREAFIGRQAFTLEYRSLGVGYAQADGVTDEVGEHGLGDGDV